MKIQKYHLNTDPKTSTGKSVNDKLIQLLQVHLLLNHPKRDFPKQTKPARPKNLGPHSCSYLNPLPILDPCPTAVLTRGL